MSGGLRLALAVLCGMRILIRLDEWMDGWTRGVPVGVQTGWLAFSDAWFGNGYIPR